MKERFTIFVEGTADVKFLQDYVETLFGVDLENENFKCCKWERNTVIQQTGGWTILNSNAPGEGYRKQIQSNMNNKGLNLLVFDADNDFDRRQKEILSWKEEHKLDFELFLLPNNKDAGNLECLLEVIINPRNQPIFDCWESFEKCLTEKSCATPLTLPAKKSKIYTYMECLCGKTKEEKDKVKDPNRDFKKTEHWNLETDKLNPLKFFLEKHLSKIINHK